jgi:ketosteroid isomerase-like protein
MSEQNLELIRHAYEDFAREGTRAIPTHLMAPDFELVLVPAFPSGPFRGPQAAVDFSKEFEAMFDEYRIEPEEIIDVGEQVLVLARFSGRGKGGGVPIVEAHAHVWTMRDGKALRAEFYSKRAEGLEAVGLTDRG